MKIVHFLNTYNGVVTAIATVFIAAFTYFSIRVSSRQAQLLSRQIALAREEFRATHRPKITIRACKISFEDPSPDHLHRCKVTYQNEGASTAYIREIGTRVFEWDQPWTKGDREIQFIADQRDVVLRPGEDGSFQLPDWAGFQFRSRTANDVVFRRLHQVFGLA